MAHHQVAAGVPSQQIVGEHEYRCACCEGIIENLSSEAVPSGLDLRLALGSDECVLVCNDCTARLVEANPARPAARRR